MTSDEQQRWSALQADVDALAGPAVGLETELGQLPRWDSLAILLVITHAEQAYGRELTGSQIRACRTARELVALLS